MNKFTFKIISFLILILFFFNISTPQHLTHTQNELSFINSLSVNNKKDENTIRIITYNLLSDGVAYGGSDVELRKNNTISLFNNLTPDVLALQEANLKWHNAISKKTNLIYVNCSPTLIKTDMTAIYYNSRNLLLTDYGKKDYKKGSNPRLRKIVWATFTDKKTGYVFSVINTHLNLSSEDNETSLIQCFELTKFANYLYNSTLSPVIITGDFNCHNRDSINNPLSSVYDILSLNLENALNCASIKTQCFEKNFSSATDHMFLKGDVPIKEINLLSHRALNRLSDHYPLYIDIKTN